MAVEGNSGQWGAASPTGISAAFRGVLRRLQAKAGRDARAVDYHAIVHNAPEIVLVVGAGGWVEYANAAVGHLLGRTTGDLVGSDIAELLHFGEGEGSPVRMRHADGSWRCFEMLSVDLGGREALYLRDITRRLELEEELVRRAFHDPLTGLANRSLFMDRLSHALAREDRYRETLGVLYIDLDDFKEVNDLFGHDAGDHVLAVLAERLQSCIRPTDTAARLGGDEFAVVLEGIAESGSAHGVARRLLRTLRQPVDWEGQQLTVTVSAGLVSGTGRSHSAAEILRAADLAMYEAKRRGKNRTTLSGGRTPLVLEGEMEISNGEHI